jgi:hypothetical protein
MSKTWAHVRYPWAATVDVTSPEPARFYVSLVRETLRYGRPAARRPRLVWTTLGRYGIPQTATAALIRSAGRLGSPPGPSEQVPAVLDRWDELVERDPTLPPRARLSVLELRRAAARTAFFFAPGNPTPLIVAKTAHGTNPGVDRETAALRRAAPAGAAPLSLGALPGVDSLQRGLPGRALRVIPIRSGRASSLSWPDELATLADGLGTLASTTAADARPDAVTDGVVEEVLAGPLLSEAAREAVTGALERVRAHPAAVLSHCDVSPQNVLMDDGRLSGLVDWEIAEDRGLPGADVWNAALAWLEQGVGLVRWSDRDLLVAFEAAWCRGAFGAELQKAAVDVVARAGVPAHLVPDLELVWLAQRVGHRTQEPLVAPTSAELAARQVELVVSTRLSGVGTAGPRPTSGVEHA